MWEELRWAGKELRWVEGRWEEVGRVEEVARGEKSWDELRRVKTRWAEVRVVEKSWEEQGIAEKSWAKVGRDGATLGAAEKSCENWEELRWSEKSWEVVVTIEKGWGKMTNSQNRVEKLWGPAASPIGTPCLWTLKCHSSETWKLPPPPSASSTCSDLLWLIVSYSIYIELYRII